MKTTYPIVLTSTKEGYTAYIPDFNLTAKGEQQSDAISAAKNAICMWAFSEENAEKSMEKVQSQIASNVHNLSFMTFYMTLEKIYLWTT